MTKQEYESSLASSPRRCSEVKLKNESDFDKALTKICSLLKCHLIDIPDMIWTRQNAQAPVRERQRPFDKVLLTPRAIYLIELKFNHGQLKDHQKLRGSRYNATRPGSYYVLRAKMNVKNPVFSVETEEKEMLFQTPELVELVKWFMERDALPVYEARGLI